ncbi:hypothetical protein HU200_004530 [Digitaria exilis]|uniref:Uncharacterized protein n=1 Tax=Digitaria exilis TaxID=1010633 RepID=A0A835FT72_9POAL|nr:hypothetical protein HU200_004530 [Digitaria exilis]
MAVLRAPPLLPPPPLTPSSPVQPLPTCCGFTAAIRPRPAPSRTASMAELEAPRRSFLRGGGGRERKGRPCLAATEEGVGAAGAAKGEEDDEEGEDGYYLVRRPGGALRRMGRVGEEMRMVAQVQAEAFHVPVALFNDFFFDFFKVSLPRLLNYLQTGLDLFRVLIVAMVLFIACAGSRLGRGAVGAHLQSEELAA